MINMLNAKIVPRQWSRGQFCTPSRLASDTYKKKCRATNTVKKQEKLSRASKLWIHRTTAHINSSWARQATKQELYKQWIVIFPRTCSSAASTCRCWHLHPHAQTRRSSLCRTASSPPPATRPDIQVNIIPWHPLKAKNSILSTATTLTKSVCQNLQLSHSDFAVAGTHSKDHKHHNNIRYTLMRTLSSFQKEERPILVRPAATSAEAFIGTFAGIDDGTVGMLPAWDSVASDSSKSARWRFPRWPDGMPSTELSEEPSPEECTSEIGSGFVRGRPRFLPASTAAAVAASRNAESGTWEEEADCTGARAAASLRSFSLGR